jgi:hypothetical protein
MEFTYQAYQELLKLLKEKKYQIATYDSWKDYERCVILRHDVDDSVDAAVKFARIEETENVVSTYFVLVTSDLYNVFSKRNQELLKEILVCGHEIGLHFDEVRYPEISGNSEELIKKILEEASILEHVVGHPITKVSMHRPSKYTLEADLKIPGMINSYGKVFFNDMKYLSDSRHHWREPVIDIIREEQFEKLHILTHPVGYNEYPTDIRSYMLGRLKNAGVDMWDILNENFTNLSEVVRREELE